ncbi:MAG: type II secretion system protein [Christensenellales bacterium]
MKNKGVTLVALIVTIVVLLILAGVSINLIVGKNGIVTRAVDVKIITRASAAEERVNLWKKENYIAREAEQETVSKEKLLSYLKEQNLVTENEIDRDREVIVIKKDDGTIVKEINYSGVIINISKYPEKGKTAAVQLEVTSIEGLTDVEELDETAKKNFIKQLEIQYHNETYGTNITDFADILTDYANVGLISSNTEDAFWDMIGENKADYINILIGNLYNVHLGQTVMVLNPEEEREPIYVAESNGTYTFKVKDLITDKTYTKDVTVDNITNDYQYYVTNFGDNIQSGKAKEIVELASLKSTNVKFAKRAVTWIIGLKDKSTNTFTTFEKAYYVYNNKKIDVTSVIKESNGVSGIDSADITQMIEEKIDKIIHSKTGLCVLVKDGVEYSGKVKIGEVN